MKTREHYLAVAERELAKAKTNLETREGECRDCRWRRLGAVRDWCASPIVRAASMNVAQGYDRKRYVECDKQRGTRMVFGGEVLCGPIGALWEPKLPWWQRLLGDE